jgi:hypothetical protein
MAALRDRVSLVSACEPRRDVVGVGQPGVDDEGLVPMLRLTSCNDQSPSEVPCPRINLAGSPTEA